MRILVVEDEEKVASFIRKGLEQMSYTVDVAGSGEEALGMALATSNLITPRRTAPRGPA